MKRIMMALAAALLCLLAFAALADTQTKSLADRFDPGLPPGMVATWQMNNGFMDIVIDTHATDWDMVAAAAKKSGSLTIHPGIHALENVKGAAFSTDIARRDGESLEAAEQRVLSNYMPNGPEAYLQEKPSMGMNGSTFECSYQGWSIGSYDEGTGLFLPTPIGQGWASFAVGWRLDDALNVERVRFNVRFTDIIPIYTSPRIVKEDDIETGVWMNQWSLTGDQAKAKVEDGRIIYTIPNVSGEAYVHTAIAAPYDAEWTAAYLLSNGREQRESGDSTTTEWMFYQDASRFGGKPYIVPYLRIEKSDVLDKKDWAIKWVGRKNGEDVTAVTGLEVVFNVGNPQFTAAYDGRDQNNNFKEAASAVPASRLQYAIRNPLDGLDVSVSNGHIHMSVDEDKLPPNRKTDLRRTTMSAKIFVPDRAERFNVYSLNGDVIYGDWGERQNLVAEGITAPKGEWMDIQEFTDRAFFSAYNVVMHNGKYMTYYTAPTPRGRYGGETLIFEWTLADGSGSREYVVLTIDAYQIKRNASETMNPNKADKSPVVQANMRMDVETAMLPQKGENVLRHEITLYDDDGNKQELKQPVTLYLPYPDGKTMDECENDVFVVYHQVGKDEYEEFSVEKGNLTLTEYGLCMEVTSFSPYYLNWEENAQANDIAALPQTDDRSSLALWLGLAMGALTLNAGLKKKKAA